MRSCKEKGGTPGTGFVMLKLHVLLLLLLHFFSLSLWIKHNSPSRGENNTRLIF